MALSQDNRTCSRFQAKKKTYALLKPFCDKLGQIKDISSCGLSFEYLDIGRHSSAHQEDQFAVDIILTSEAFYLSQVPCEIVYDTPSSSPDAPPEHVAGLENRRCGLRFIDMNHEQQEALEAFLGKHAIKSDSA